MLRVGSVVVVLLTLVAAPAARTSAQPPEPPAEVLVLFEDGADAASAGRGLGARHGVAVGRTYPSPPTAVVRATPGQRRQLEADAAVRATLARGHTVDPALAQSVPLIGAPARWNRGFTGTGSTVAVIDTGVSGSYGGTLVGQACFTAGRCGTSADVSAAYDSLCFSAGVCDADDALDAAAAAPCGHPSPSEGCQHGSAVAATAARSQSGRGVAPGADVYAVRVFDAAADGAPVGGDLVDIYEAILHLIEMHDRGAIDLAAVNISLSGGVFNDSCGAGTLDGAGALFSAAFAALRARDIAPVVASGNQGRVGAMGFPACVSNSVPAGASSKTDAVVPFSNRVPRTVMAPGAGLQVTSAPGFTTAWDGTSFSAPHVAGMLAILAQELPRATLAQRLWVLDRGGRAVSDGRASYRRLGLDMASLPAGRFVPGGTSGAAVARAGDFDGDGNTDIIFHNTSTGAGTVRFGRGDRWELGRAVSQFVGTGAQILVGNFRGGTASPDDIVVYRPGSGADELWVGRSDRTFARSRVSVSGTYQVHTGDFDGDGRTDIFWYGPGSTPDYIWYGGSTAFVSLATPVSGSYRVAIGDFSGDGRDDVFFHSPGTAADYVWTATARRGRLRSTALAINGTYVPLALRNRSAADDLLLYAAGPAPDFLWTGRTTIPSTAARAGFGQVGVTVNGTYTPTALDVDSNGLDDIAWYSRSSSVDYVWRRPGRTTFASAPASMPAGRTVVPADLDGAGGDDIVFAGHSVTPIWWAHPRP